MSIITKSFSKNFEVFRFPRDIRLDSGKTHFYSLVLQKDESIRIQIHQIKSKSIFIMQVVQVTLLNSNDYNDVK